MTSYGALLFLWMLEIYVSQTRRRAFGPALLALLVAALVVPQAAPAALVTMQYRPATQPPPAAADLTPIAPFDAAWNPPTPASSGGVRGNVIPRPGDPSATTTDYVEFNRTVPQGIDEDGPLRGSLMVDFDKLEPGLPAVVAIHGGLVKGKLCAPAARRLTQTLFAREFAAKGYIVFLPDFTRPTNDAKSGILGWLMNSGNTGDCMADDGWEPGAKKAQISLQLAVRSLKVQLRQFAQAHPGAPSAPAFDRASRKVVAFGGSSGAHMAARLALRSEDASGAPGDGPQFQNERRVAAAVGIGGIGECTASNPLRNFRRVFGLDAFPASYVKPFASCGTVTPDAADSPIRFYNGASTYKDWFGKWQRYPSPLTGSGSWGRNLGWDFVADARWPARTCEGLSPGSCTAKVYPVEGTNTHYIFPHEARPPGSPTSTPTYWQSTVFPEIDALFRSAKSDDEVGGAS